MVHVEEIWFNHNEHSASNDAMNIRINAAVKIDRPEWKQSRSEQFPAAYSIRETRGRTITIQARFSSNLRNGSLQIRAKDYGYPSSNVLGEVRARAVSFGADGDSGVVSFDLHNVRLQGFGVGIYIVTWQWQYFDVNTNSWTVFDATSHRIYSVLAIPVSPWQEAATGGDQIPWTDAMDFACAWAKGARHPIQAAANITYSVNDLGPRLVEYDWPDGAPGYTTLVSYNTLIFHCTDFIELLRGSGGAGRLVNCTDCANIVTTFANLLGCELWESRMAAYFDLNPVSVIGHAGWRPQPGSSHRFVFHEVAWTGGCDVEDRVFDACLHVDGDHDPTIDHLSHTPILPVNMRFGIDGDGEYRDRLAIPGLSGRGSCNPQPASRRRNRIE